MKKMLIAGLMLIAGSANANVLCWVDSYVKANGTVVASYIRSQTACVTTADAVLPGSTAGAAKFLAGVGTIVGIIALRDAYNKAEALQITNEDHSIVECTPKITRQSGVVSKPGPMTIVVGKDKAIAFYSTFTYTETEVHHTNTFSRKENNLYRKSLFGGSGTVEFDLSTSEFVNYNTAFFGLGKDVYSCKTTLEAKVQM